MVRCPASDQIRIKALTSILACVSIAAVAAQQQPLVLVTAIPLPSVQGRIDHLAFDMARQRLFVAALGNDTVEVIDTSKAIHLKSLSGFHEPQGIAAAVDVNGIAVANGDSGTLDMIDAETLQRRWTVSVGGDADNIRYDPAGRRLYVAVQGGIVIIDPATGKEVQRIRIGGHPESFQLERAGSRMFINLPGTGQVVVADRSAEAVLTKWPLGPAASNYPMALDESTARLFVGCRHPAAVIAYDTASGKRVAQIETVGDTDDLFYDAARKRLYVIGGDGFVDVFQPDGDSLRRVARLATAAGARTGLYVPDSNRLYLAVPRRGRQSAEIRVFETRN
jgi:YVTN family beta-propeller protein